MEKRSSVGAVFAESLVLESNLALAVVPETSSSNEVIQPAQGIPAWSAAALVCENAGTSDTPTSPVDH